MIYLLLIPYFALIFWFGFEIQKAPTEKNTGDELPDTGFEDFID